MVLAADDTKHSAQPIAIVRPLRLHHDEPNYHEGTAVLSDSQDQEQNSSDVEVTIISESPLPITYIGNPSEELGETSEVTAVSSTKVVSLDSQPSGVVESDPGSDHEFVIVPGEVIRRRGSILKNPNAPVSDCSVLFILREITLFQRVILNSTVFSKEAFEVAHFLGSSRDRRRLAWKYLIGMAS